MSYSAYPVRPDLGAAALSFTTEGDRFIADDVLPQLSVASQSAAFERYGVEVGTQLPGDIQRRPGADFKQVGYGKKDDYYATKEQGVEEHIDFQDEWTVERFQREEEMKAQRLMRIVAAKREQRAAALTVSSSVFANGTNYGKNVSAVWSGAGTPLEDVEFAIQKVIDQSGAYPNLWELPREAWSALSKNDSVVARLSVNVDNAGMIPLQRLQDIFGIAKIVVPHVPYNTAPNGATPSIGQIWPKTKSLIAYVRTDALIEEVQLGRTMVWDAPGYSGGIGSTVTWQNHPRRMNMAHFQNVGEKVLEPACGYVLHGILS